MSKTLKITLVLFIILCSICSFSLATDIDMNISADNSDNVISVTNNTALNTTTNTINKNNTVKTNSISGQEADTLSQSTTVSSVNQSSTDDGLGLSNILNILLIVVGVVLILLAIAILIRLHS